MEYSLKLFYGTTEKGIIQCAIHSDIHPVLFHEREMDDEDEKYDVCKEKAYIIKQNEKFFIVIYREKTNSCDNNEEYTWEVLQYKDLPKELIEWIHWLASVNHTSEED